MIFKFAPSDYKIIFQVTGFIVGGEKFHHINVM